MYYIIVAIIENVNATMQEMSKQEDKLFSASISMGRLII